LVKRFLQCRLHKALLYTVKVEASVARRLRAPPKALMP